MSHEREYGAPFPSTLEEAIEEIHSLRQRLYLSNQRWSAAADREQQTRRSCSGTVKKLQAELEEARRLSCSPDCLRDKGIVP